MRELALTMTGDRVEDAQDASQEAFLRLFRHLKRFNAEREFAPWLYRVTVNVCHDIARRRERDATLRFGESASWTDPSAELSRVDEKRMVAEATVRSQVSSARLKIRRFVDRAQRRRS